MRRHGVDGPTALLKLNDRQALKRTTWFIPWTRYAPSLQDFLGRRASLRLLTLSAGD